MVHRQNVEVTNAKSKNVERQNGKWDKMPNDKMLNGKKCRLDKMLNGTKRRIDTMSKVRKADWDKMSNGTKNVKSKQCQNQKTYCNVEKGLLCIINP